MPNHSLFFSASFLPPFLPSTELEKLAGQTSALSVDLHWPTKGCLGHLSRIHQSSRTVGRLFQLCGSSEGYSSLDRFEYICIASRFRRSWSWAPSIYVFTNNNFVRVDLIASQMKQPISLIWYWNVIVIVHLNLSFCSRSRPLYPRGIIGPSSCWRLFLVLFK